jgi:uncharacterized small protein (DUF1192 family)
VVGKLFCGGKVKRRPRIFGSHFYLDSRLNFISTDTTATMDSATQSADSLRKQIAATEEELKRLKAQLASVEAHDGTNAVKKSLQGLEVDDASPVTHGKWPLSAEEYKRYGRQMIIPSIGIQGIFYSILFRILC